MHLLLLSRGQHHDHLTTFNPAWERLTNSDVCHVVFNPVEDFNTDVQMRHFTTTIPQRYFGFVTLFNEATQVA